jgi:hypothetical protein
MPLVDPVHAVPAQSYEDKKQGLFLANQNIVAHPNPVDSGIEVLDAGREDMNSVVHLWSSQA